jgi:hypothetical protein
MFGKQRSLNGVEIVDVEMDGAELAGSLSPFGQGESCEEGRNRQWRLKSHNDIVGQSFTAVLRNHDAQKCFGNLKDSLKALLGILYTLQWVLSVPLGQPAREPTDFVPPESAPIHVLNDKRFDESRKMVRHSQIGRNSAYDDRHVRYCRVHSVFNFFYSGIL